MGRNILKDFGGNAVQVPNPQVLIKSFLGKFHFGLG
jgi:hypothetical protein